VILSVDDLTFYRSKRPILLDGAFDPLHAGHIRYLQSAVKAFPDSLVICAIASDDDIRAKGREPLLDQRTRAEVVQSLKCIDLVVLKDRPVEQIIAKLRPGAYVKGKDWEGRLPDEQMAACSLYGVQIVFLDTVTDSATDRLRAWALRDADQSLDRLETFMAAQPPANPEKFDTAYFQGDWRADGNTYTFEKRKEIEGKHPELIVECFPQMSILDVGCGPGYLVRMLKELGVTAMGIDTAGAAVAMAEPRTCVLLPITEVPSGFVAVAICREVLEHVPVREIPAMVCDLFRVARRFVYITTRFQDGAVFDAATEFEVDPTHVSLLSQPFLRSLCVLNGGKRRRDLETKLDHMNKGRCLVYEIQ
jgi:cytidyltransferase-like protein